MRRRSTNRRPTLEMVQRVVVPGTESQLEQIDAMTPPAGDEAEIDAILAAAQEGVDAIKDDPRELTKGALDKGTQLAAAYGFEVCGSDE